MIVDHWKNDEQIIEFIISVCQMKWLLVEAENFDTVNEILKFIFYSSIHIWFQKSSLTWKEHDLFIFAPYVSHWF